MRQVARRDRPRPRQDEEARRAPESAAPAAAVLRLQRSVGNHATARLLQRDVGMEFEVSGTKVRHAQAPLTDEQRLDYELYSKFNRKPDKGTVLLEGDQFDLSTDTDGSDTDAEFVTKAFPETPGGRGQLEQAVRRITNVAAAVDDLRPHQMSELQGRGFGTARFTHSFVAGGFSLAEPQTTAGIRLEHLATFLEQIGGRHAEFDPSAEAPPASMELGGMGGQTLPDWFNVGESVGLARGGVQRFKTANPGLARKFGSEELVGVVALILTYLHAGTRAGLQYTKAIAPLMARTNLAQVMRGLPEAEAFYFKTRPDQFERLVVGSEVPPLDPTLRVFLHPVGHGAAAVPLPLTRREWLRWLPLGTDKLTAYDWPDPATRGEISEGLGGMKTNTDPAGKDGRERAPIFEMRRMQQGVDRANWVGLALDVFDFVAQINRGRHKPYKRKHH